MENEFVCKICRKFFNRKDSLTRHMETTHSNERKYKCTHCEHRSNQACNLKTHIRNMHSDKETITEEDIKAACILSSMKGGASPTTIIDVTGDSNDVTTFLLNSTASSINPDGHKRKSKKRKSKRKSKKRSKRKSKF